MLRNLLLATDSNKHSSFLQYPPGTTHLCAYIEARDKFNGGVTQFFGLQAFLRRYLSKPITRKDIVEADRLCSAHGVPFNRKGFEEILEKHGGYLPLEIQALPEGVVAGRGTPLVQVTNTDPEMAWLTTFIETALLRGIWYPSSVATYAFLIRTILYDALVRTSDDPNGQIDSKVCDFGARAVTSSESAGLGGMAYLVNFRATNTMEGLAAASEYYDADMAGLAIPASEHSTVTSWGKDREKESYANLISRFGEGAFSLVADSYDIFNAITILGDTFKERIENIPGKLYVRSDSGDPITTPVEVIDRLAGIFGTTVNSKGFRVLNPKVGVIQSDDMSSANVVDLVRHLISKGYSIDNITFGQGGHLLQDHLRTNMSFAMKVNAIRVNNGDWVDVRKNPATDPTKASKPGRQAVVLEDSEYIAVREDELDGRANCLQPFYRNGDILVDNTLDDIRARGDLSLHLFHRKVFNKAA